MSYFPIFVEMTGRRCLVIGGGAVAERKIAALLEAGTMVVVISPEISETIARWSKEQRITFTARHYRPGDLIGFQLAFIATDDPEVNNTVFDEGRERGGPRLQHVQMHGRRDVGHCGAACRDTRQRERIGIGRLPLPAGPCAAAVPATRPWP